MSLDSRAGVSIFELCIYFPSIVVSAIVCSRHGFGRNSGWIFILILCLVRIIGACCQLATYQSGSSGLLEAVIILDSIGISPMLLATLGLLSRWWVNFHTGIISNHSNMINSVDATSNISSIGFKATHFRLLQVLITVGLILCIAGGTSITSSAAVYNPPTTTKAGVVLYLIAFLALYVIAAVTTGNLSNAPSDSKRLVWAVIGAFPFILVRLIYSLISTFSNNSQFNLVTGSVVIHVFMAVLEEMAVVCIYLAAGWTTNVLAPSERGHIASRPWKGSSAGRNDIQDHIGRRQEPIHSKISVSIAALRRNEESGV